MVGAMINGAHAILYSKVKPTAKAKAKATLEKR
jgi:hypothetical protein